MKEANKRSRGWRTKRLSGVGRGRGGGEGRRGGGGRGEGGGGSELVAHLDVSLPTISFSSGESTYLLTPYSGNGGRWKGEGIRNPKGWHSEVATLVAGPAWASPEPIQVSRPVQERVSGLMNEESMD